MDNKRFYWLKLKKDFFKRHDIRIVEDMPNGKDYILFYLKLLVESVDHEGELRFSESIPYNEQMLATITNTNVDLVRSAMKVFTDLKMIEILDDQTIYMTEVSKMIGSAVDNDNANRQRNFRERKKAEQLALNVTKSNACITDCVTEDNESKSKSQSKNQSKSQSFYLKTPDFVPPTIEEVYKYCEDRHNGINPQLFFDYYTARGWKNIIDWKAAVRTWENNNKKADYL